MKKLVKLILLIFMVAIIPYKADALVVTYDRDSTNNYGVNKHWNITDDNMDNITSTPYVDATSKIYDFSDILTTDQEEELYNRISSFINSTNMDMVIVTYNLPYTFDSDNETFAADFYDYNDFGIDFENYSGVLLFRNTYEQDRYYDIYTFGNAQLYFDYDRLNTTLDNIYYDFVNNNYFTGMATFIEDMSNYYIEGIYDKYEDYYVDEDGFIQKKYVPPITVALIIASITTLVVMLVMINKNKMVKKASKADDYLITSSIRYDIKENVLTHSSTSSYRISSLSSSGGSSGGFSSSSGSSGGGHSSGGGRHG